MATAHFTFHGALNFFLPSKQQHQTLTHEFNWKASIKDMLESLGPPHPEVALLVVNGVSVGWDHTVQDGDEAHAYPDFDAIQLVDKVRLIAPIEDRPRFILDTHLGKLAGYLRMMGFDTLYRNDYADDVLAQVSHDEQRIVLTRDVGVLKRGIVTYGYFVRSTDPRERIHEISQRYDLAAQVEPFKHCMKCNGLLMPVEKSAILSEIPHDTAQHYDTFHRCQSCERIYWPGSHYVKMQRLLDDVLTAE